VDETRAWACLAMNLAVLPGLGSLVARNRWGYAQVLLALAGFALTCRWLFGFLAAWSEPGAFPLDSGPSLAWGLGGILLFVAAWLWSLVSGLALVRKSTPRSARRR